VALLELHGISCGYGQITALHQVDLEVPQGSVVTLIGANGAGKTSTLRAISGLLPLRAGRILFNGKTIAAPPGAERRLPRAHEIVALGIAHAPEGRRIFPTLTVLENLTMGGYTLGRDRQALQENLQRVFQLFPRLHERRRQLGGTLSGGEQQMLAIARALMARPTLLLLDEPSLGLAPMLVRTIFETIREINRQGVTVLLVEQNARAALRLAHHAYVLETGRTTLHGPAVELARDPRVAKAFLGGR
jgi:branched-chain amino acid transport system ATP-binding protein